MGSQLVNHWFLAPCVFTIQPLVATGTFTCMVQILILTTLILILQPTIIHILSIGVTSCPLGDNPRILNFQRGPEVWGAGFVRVQGRGRGEGCSPIPLCCLRNPLWGGGGRALPPSQANSR